MPEHDADGELAEWYRRVGNSDGTVDNVMKVHSLNVDSLRTHFEMYTQACHAPSPLTRAQREMVAVVVSRANGCEYCLRHHTAGLVRLLPEGRKAVAEALVNGETAGLTERELAMTAYATKLATEPQQMTEADVAALRAAGLDDRAVLDLVQCVGYFCYVNRIVTGLGVALAQGEGAPGQWPE
ncbi:MAG: peroxidase-related enzyme [Planctomycetota bacterium]